MAGYKSDERWQQLEQAVGALEAVVRELQRHEKSAGTDEFALGKPMLAELESRGQRSTRECQTALEEAEMIALECSTPDATDAADEAIGAVGAECGFLKAELAAAKLGCSRGLAMEGKRQRESLLSGAPGAGLRKRAGVKMSAEQVRVLGGGGPCLAAVSIAAR